MIAVAPASAAGSASNARLLAGPRVLDPGPANGRFADGYEGWTILGRVPPEPFIERGAGVVVRLIGNTTLISPPFAVPDGAQAVLVRSRAPTRSALLLVRALPTDGGPEIPLRTVLPGSSMTGWHVPLPVALQGREIRLVLDPVPTLGGTLDIGGIGPVSVRLPGFTLIRGLPRIERAGGRRALSVVDERVEIQAEPFDQGPGARFLSFALRGDGVVRAEAGARGARFRAREEWRTVRLRFRAGDDGVRLNLRAQPGQDALQLRDIGVVVRASSLRGLTVRRRGAVARVRGRVVPEGAGARVRLRVGGRVAGRAIAGADGRFVVRTRARGRGRLEVVASDGRLPTARLVRLVRAARAGSG